MLPRTSAAAAAAPAPTGAGRILEFWECLTPPSTHTAPRCQPQPRGLPRRLQPRCGLAAGSPSRIHFARTGLLFLFSRRNGGGGQVLVSGCSHGLGCLSAQRSEGEICGERGLVLLRTCQLLPPSTTYPFDKGLAGIHLLPQILLQGSPNPARKLPEAEGRGCRVRCARPHH